MRLTSFFPRKKRWAGWKLVRIKASSLEPNEREKIKRIKQLFDGEVVGVYERRIPEMIKYDIRIPLWGRKAVGLGLRFDEKDVELNILAEDKSGNRMWPDTYISRWDKRQSYPVETMRGGVPVRVHAIADLEVVK
jgi:hypothetical protein